MCRTLPATTMAVNDDAEILIKAAAHPGRIKPRKRDWRCEDLLRAIGPFFLNIPPLTSVHDIIGFRYDPMDSTGKRRPITPSQVNVERISGPLRYAVVEKPRHPVRIVSFEKSL